MPPARVPDPAEPRRGPGALHCPDGAVRPERFGGEARELADGGVEVRVAGDSERWLVQWVLSFGGEAEVLEPAWAREAVSRAALRALEETR